MMGVDAGLKEMWLDHIGRLGFLHCSANVAATGRDKVSHDYSGAGPKETIIYFAKVLLRSIPRMILTPT